MIVITVWKSWPLNPSCLASEQNRHISKGTTSHQYQMCDADKMAVVADMRVGALGFKWGPGKHMEGDSELGTEGWVRRNSRCKSWKSEHQRCRYSPYLSNTSMGLSLNAMTQAFLGPFSRPIPLVHAVIFWCQFSNAKWVSCSSV